MILKLQSHMFPNQSLESGAYSLAAEGIMDTLVMFLFLIPLRVGVRDGWIPLKMSMPYDELTGMYSHKDLVRILAKHV